MAIQRTSKQTGKAMEFTFLVVSQPVPTLTRMAELPVLGTSIRPSSLLMTH